MWNVILTLGALVGGVTAFVAGALNSQTPVQVGPVPFFGGGLVFAVCTIALIARIATGH